MWYRFGFDRDSMSLRFFVHQLAFDSLKGVLQKGSYAFSLSEAFGFDFIAPCEGDFGYDCGIEFVGVSGDWFELSLTIPKRVTTARSGHISAKCLCSNVWLLSSLLLIIGDSSIGNSFSQLITIDYIGLEVGSGRCGLVATLSEAAVSMIERGNTESFSDYVVDCMRAVWGHMLSKREVKLWPRDFRLRFEDDGRMSFCVPGNACDLSTDGNYSRYDDSCVLVPHNVDGFHQQITFLVGLSALHDKLMQKS